MCSDALEDEPECVPLLLIRARAHIALRRDLEAQTDLRDIIRLDPQNSLAYRLLGELAARRDENESAAIFFREALRLDPHDQEAADWLLIVDTSSSSLRPAAVAQQLPAPAAAAGRFPAEQRLARGTHPPVELHDERPTRPFARGSDRHGDRWGTPGPELLGRKSVTLALDDCEPVRPHRPGTELGTPPPLPPPPRWGVGDSEVRTKHGRPPTQPPAKAAPRAATTRPMPRPAIAEAPGFGEYLVAQGILTRERLRAAQAYQRSMKVQLSTAIVTLGLATPQRIEWAAVAHQSGIGTRPPE